MGLFRQLIPAEQRVLEGNGCFAEDWGRVRVADPFSPSQLTLSRFRGDVEIGVGAQVHSSTISNYTLGEGSTVECVTLLECTGSSFGNGVKVASLNECGGRSITIHRALTAQTAYIATTARHRAQLIERLECLSEAVAQSSYSAMGVVGDRTRLLGCGIIRNIYFDCDVTAEGISSLSNGSILRGAYIGADVKAHDFIAVEGSTISNGAILERCFVGESAIISNGFTAVDSLFFASSHCENGEAASIFAGPYTVSHHKSSLLIAGMFSFFNAGSGSNQSNHLFRCGPVHQGVHLRGCKFGSSAYVMLPAVNGAYTSVIGSHSAHHDTSEFPFSYLINKDGRSTLLPAASISSWGYVRDIEKWKSRDRRKVKRDIINFEEHNPYIGGMVIDAINRANTLKERYPDAATYSHNNVAINAKSLDRGLAVYNKFIASSLGEMLAYPPDDTLSGEGRCRWVDIAGQYLPQSRYEALMSGVESGEIGSLEAIDEFLRRCAEQFEALSRQWAVGILGELLGHTPSSEEIEQAIKSSQGAREAIEALQKQDMQRDNSAKMSLSYGIDTSGEEDRIADFHAVRGL